jgi:hypothetical protein
MLQRPRRIQPGQPAYPRFHGPLTCSIYEPEGIEPGTAVVFTADRIGVRTPVFQGLDPDAIATGIASQTTEQTAGPTLFDGEIGGEALRVSDKVTIALNAHVDWTGGDLELSFIDQNGQLVTETFTIPAGGDTVFTTSAIVNRVLSLYIPGQDGENGVVTLGTAGSDPTLTAYNCPGILFWNPGKAGQPYDNSSLVPFQDMGSYADTDSYGVQTVVGVRQGAPAYVIVAGADAGRFTDVSTPGTSVPRLGWSFSNEPVDDQQITPVNTTLTDTAILRLS